MKTIKLLLAGYGNVGKAFAQLILSKQAELQRDHSINFLITGISTGSHGCLGLDNGFDLVKLTKDTNGFSEESFPEAQVYTNTMEMVEKSDADVLIEISPVNYETGQPAVDHIKQALEKNMHAVTANKGPIVHAYTLLKDLAAKNGKRFFFESTVMDGAPVFSVLREVLPAMQVEGFEGILNSCTNLILCRMEDGDSFDEAVQYAQSIGIAETDPSGDVDGWDAAVKVAALSTVILNNPATPQDVKREGIRNITSEAILKAKKEGKRWKLICKAELVDGKWELSVGPQLLSASSPYFSVEGTGSSILFKSDVLPGLGIFESEPSPNTTAYGLLADILNIYK